MRREQIDEIDLGEGEEPTGRADVAIERQTHEMTATMGDLRLRTASDEPVHSPSGMATAGLKTALAGLIASAPFITGGYLLHVPAWLALVLAMLAFLPLVTCIGVVIITRELRRGAAPCTVRQSRAPWSVGLTSPAVTGSRSARLTSPDAVADARPPVRATALSPDGGSSCTSFSP
ncbi:hypothetical protein GCM10023196_085310 [Actinoallomurus vinaceus]|uniref:Uncharacterized protein n=1 Tax=Actinoallomurus vinaceus TaxID=1080074 RepID=A0ABP8UNL6_9ACTN